MADGSTFRSVSAQDARALVWRKPVWLWAPVTLVLGAGWPLLFLNREGGLAEFAALLVGLALVLALGALALAFFIGRPPRSRGQIVIYVATATAILALLAPFVYAGFTRPAEGEGGQAVAKFEVAGLKPDMAWMLAPLALAVGTPAALAAGLTLAALCFRKHDPTVVVARRISDLSEQA